MSTSPAVDVHVHLAPALSPTTVTRLGLGESDGRLVVNGHPVGPGQLYEPDRLDAWLESVGIDRAWVSIPPPFFRQGLGFEATGDWITAVNDGLLDVLAGRGRLEALAYLPLDEPEAAVQELDRLSPREDVTGWAAAAGGRSLALDHARLEPLWTSIETSNRPMLLHPGSSPDARLTPHYLSNLLGNPIETALAAAQLVFGDVLASHPALRLVLVHCGGTVPALVGRWQQGLDTRRPGVVELRVGPREAVRRFWVDALAHDAAAVDLAASAFGEDKLVLGSDWPFPMGLTNPWTSVAHLPTDQQQRVGRDNVVALRGASR